MHMWACIGMCICIGLRIHTHTLACLHIHMHRHNVLCLSPCENLYTFLYSTATTPTLYTQPLPPQQPQGEENQPPNVPPPPLTKKPVMQVTQKKYNMIKNLLTMKLQEVEDAQAAAQQEGEAVVLEGMKQHDLTKWFFEHQQQRYVLCKGLFCARACFVQGVARGAV